MLKAYLRRVDGRTSEDVIGTISERILGVPSQEIEENIFGEKSEEIICMNVRKFLR